MLNTHKFLIMGNFNYRTCKELVVGFWLRESRQYPVRKGPYIKDVRKIFVIFNPPLSPFVRFSRNLSVLFVRKIWQFSNPPPPLSADVLYVWSQSVRAFGGA